MKIELTAEDRALDVRKAYEGMNVVSDYLAKEGMKLPPDFQEIQSLIRRCLVAEETLNDIAMRLSPWRYVPSYSHVVKKSASACYQAAEQCLGARFIPARNNDSLSLSHPEIETMDREDLVSALSNARDEVEALDSRLRKLDELPTSEEDHETDLERAARELDELPAKYSALQSPATAAPQPGTAPPS